MYIIKRLTIAAAFSIAASAAFAQDSLPSPILTPGATNPEVMQETIGQTICVPGWTQTVRPPASYTNALKRQGIRAYGYADRKMADFEEDHLIPLALGGAPRDPRNLWPEPRHPSDGWTVVKKDQLEVTLQHLVCKGALPLVQAQQAISSDWRSAFWQYEVNGRKQ
jgi:hypothetical protein